MKCFWANLDYEIEGSLCARLLTFGLAHILLAPLLHSDAVGPLSKTLNRLKWGTIDQVNQIRRSGQFLQTLSPANISIVHHELLELHGHFWIEYGWVQASAHRIDLCTVQGSRCMDL